MMVRSGVPTGRVYVRAAGRYETAVRVYHGAEGDAAVFSQVRIKTPCRRRRWANFSRLWLCSHRNAWANDPTCIFWASLTAFSLQRWPEGARGTALGPPKVSRRAAAATRAMRGAHEASFTHRAQRVYLLHGRKGIRLPACEPEIHRVDSESGSTLRLLQGFSVKLLGQLANFGSTL